MSVAIAFSAVGFAGVNKASAAITVSTYFGVGSDHDTTAKIDNEKLVVTVNNEEVDGKTVIKETAEMSVSNKLVINDFEVKFTPNEHVTAIALSLTATSFYGIGYDKSETEDSDITTEVENIVKIDVTSNKVTMNDSTETEATTTYTVSGDDSITLKLGVDNGSITAKVNNGTEVKDSTELKKVDGNDKVVATLKFTYTTDKKEVADNESDIATVSFEYFDQGTTLTSTDDSGATTYPYRQTFTDSALETNGKALPRVAITEAFLVDTNNNVKLKNGKEYTVKLTSYSLLGYSATGSYFLSNTNDSTKSVDKDSYDKIWLNNSDTPTKIAIKNNENNTAQNFYVKIKTADDTYTVIETYSATVYDSEDGDTPKYNEVPEEVLKAFQSTLENKLYETYSDGSKKHVKLGTSIEIPSMRGFVSDKTTSYDNLTHTMYYLTPSSSTGSTDSWSITLSDAGTYRFYVVFKNEAGNAMEKDDFFTTDDDGEFKEWGKYKKYVFEFTMEDDAPVVVEAPTATAAGYLNTTYTFSAFTIESSSYTPTYTLYYRPENSSEDDYKAITAKSKLSTEANYTSTDFTYAEQTGFAYDGSLTFTPIKKGYYKLECTVTSNKLARSETASQTVEITQNASKVKTYDNSWWKNNWLSVMFLGIGTLCLIGIIILLFIKPKEPEEKYDTPKDKKDKTDSTDNTSNTVNTNSTDIDTPKETE